MRQTKTKIINYHKLNLKPVYPRLQVHLYFPGRLTHSALF